MSRKMSPVLQARSQWLHTGSDSTNGETCSDNWVRMEEQSLDDIQNIGVSEEEGTF